MEDTNVGTFTKVHTTVTFVAMIVVNALANIIRFNGMTTGEVSDSYPNLFAPAGLTFSIWGVIYILLGGYVLYQFGYFIKKESTFSKDLIEKIGILFTISSIAYTAWIFVWHYRAIEISLALMAVILVCLIIINIMVGKAELTTREKIFIRLPFSIYFGWIVMATIANVTVFLVSIEWNRFGLPEMLWTILVLIVGLFITGLTIFKNQNLGFGIAVIWAYIGILIRHTSPLPSGFGGKYPLIILVLILCIMVLLIEEVYIAVTDKEKLKNFRLFKKKTEQ